MWMGGIIFQMIHSQPVYSPPPFYSGSYDWSGRSLQEQIHMTQISGQMIQKSVPLQEHQKYNLAHVC